MATKKATSKSRRPFLFYTTTGSGGEGNRTPVRDKIDQSVYVRILLIEVSVCWPTESPQPNKFAFVLPNGGKRTVRLAQIFDTHVPPRAGCLVSTAG